MIIEKKMIVKDNTNISSFMRGADGLTDDRDFMNRWQVFPSAVWKWRKVLRIRIIFYVTGQKMRYIKVLPRHWTGSRSQKAKDKAVSFRKLYRNNFLAASVGSRARLNHAQTWSPLLYIESIKPNKQNVSEINLFKKFNFSQYQNNCWHADWFQEWNIKTSLLKIRKIKYTTLLSGANVPVRFGRF